MDTALATVAEHMHHICGLNLSIFVDIDQAMSPPAFLTTPAPILEHLEFSFVVDHFWGYAISVDKLFQSYAPKLHSINLFGATMSISPGSGVRAFSHIQAAVIEVDNQFSWRSQVYELARRCPGIRHLTLTGADVWGKQQDPDSAYVLFDQPLLSLSVHIYDVDSLVHEYGDLPVVSSVLACLSHTKIPTIQLSLSVFYLMPVIRLMFRSMSNITFISCLRRYPLFSATVLRERLCGFGRKAVYLAFTDDQGRTWGFYVHDTESRPVEWTKFQFFISCLDTFRTVEEVEFDEECDHLMKTFFRLSTQTIRKISYIIHDSTRDSKPSRDHASVSIINSKLPLPRLDEVVFAPMSLAKPLPYCDVRDRLLDDSANVRLSSSPAVTSDDIDRFVRTLDLGTESSKDRRLPSLIVKGLHLDSPSSEFPSSYLTSKVETIKVVPSWWTS